MPPCPPPAVDIRMVNNPCCKADGRQAAGTRSPQEIAAYRPMTAGATIRYYFGRTFGNDRPAFCVLADQRLRADFSALRRAAR